MPLVDEKSEFVGGPYDGATMHLGLDVRVMKFPCLPQLAAPFGPMPAFPGAAEKRMCSRYEESGVTSSGRRRFVFIGVE